MRSVVGHPRSLVEPRDTKSDRTTELFRAWRSAEQRRDRGPQVGGAFIEACEIAERARIAYLRATAITQLELEHPDERANEQWYG
jgi:hypothetical protein